MYVKRFARTALISSLALATLQTVQAQVPVKLYAQELVDRIVTQRPDLRAVAIHASPTKGGPNVIIASNFGRIGKPADEGDLAVISSGKPRVSMDRGNKRIEIDLPLRDVGGETVGSLALAWRFPVAGSQAEFERIAGTIRDALARRILNGANLMDAYPFEAAATTKTRAQTLVDEALLRHPQVTVLALRSRSGPGGELTLLGSTFGRHGKKADADDMKVLASPTPAADVYSNGRRFGVDLALRDRSGTPIGTMNVGYAWRAGEDTKPLLAHAISLRDELQVRIAETPALDELDP